MHIYIIYLTKSCPMLNEIYKSDFTKKNWATSLKLNGFINVNY